MPSDPRDYKLDVSISRPPDPAAGASSRAAVPSRPFLSVHFACCGAYQRVYRDPDGTQYQGRCPRCGKPVRFAVGAGGTSVRTFTVS